MLLQIAMLVIGLATAGLIGIKLVALMILCIKALSTQPA
jgi:hypothetical protein